MKELRKIVIPTPQDCIDERFELVFANRVTDILHIKKELGVFYLYTWEERGSKWSTLDPLNSPHYSTIQFFWECDGVALPDQYVYLGSTELCEDSIQKHLFYRKTY
jgi:hypothetical protein